MSWASQHCLFNCTFMPQTVWHDVFKTCMAWNLKTKVFLYLPGMDFIIIWSRYPAAYSIPSVYNYYSTKCFFCPNFQVSQLLINSHKFKHEVTRDGLLILDIYLLSFVWHDKLLFVHWATMKRTLISITLLKYVEISLPKSLTNQNFLGVSFHSQLLHHWLQTPKLMPMK